MTSVSIYGRWISVCLLCFYVIHISQASPRRETTFSSAPTASTFSCADNEMLLPLRLTLGNTSDTSCHNLITAGKLTGRSDINRCCTQRRNDNAIEYCIPGKSNLIKSKYYLDFINSCTGTRSCTLKPDGSSLQNPSGEDYMVFEYDCIDDTSVIHVMYSDVITGKEVYLYTDQRDGDAFAHCAAYAGECLSTVNTEIVASNIQSPMCTITYTDRYRSSTMNCKAFLSNHSCSPTYRSQSDSVDMSISMTVDTQRRFNEFLWIKITSSSNSDVTVACGSRVLPSLPNNCPLPVLTSKPTTTPTSTSANPRWASSYRTSPAPSFASTDTSVAVTGGNIGSKNVFSDHTIASTATATATKTTANHNGKPPAATVEQLIHSDAFVIGIGSLLALACVVIAVLSGCHIKLKRRLARHKSKDDKEEHYCYIQDTEEPGHTKERRGYPTEGRGYPTEGRGYPTEGRGYPTEGRGYPTEGRGYPTEGRGYPTEGRGYPTEGQGYPTEGRGYPTEGRGYPTAGPRHPMEGSRYPTQGPCYSTERPPNTNDRSQYFDNAAYNSSTNPDGYITVRTQPKAPAQNEHSSNNGFQQ